jgi:hypothetical protein
MYVLVTDARGRLTLRKAGPWRRFVVRVKAAGLDGKLARGEEPEVCEYLAVRAQQLTSPRFRRVLAASLRRLLTEPGRPTARPTGLPMVSGRRIRAAAADLTALAERLEAPGPVLVRGVALTRQLLTEGTGPLYERALYDGHGPGALRDAARRAASALAS